MNLQTERIETLARAMDLESLAQAGISLSQTAAEQDWTFTDYLEQLLSQEQHHRRQRKQALYSRLAAFPAHKTLEGFDFNFATGVPKKHLIELASMRFVERCENIILLGPSGVGR